MVKNSVSSRNALHLSSLRKRGSTPRVSIIIVAFNGHEWLANCIESLINQSYVNTEIIAVDNAADYDVKEMLRSFPAVVYIKRKRNDGLSHALNAAVKRAHGKYIIIANEDMSWEKKYIEQLVLVMESDSSVGCVQGIVKNADGKTLQSCGSLLNHKRFLVPNKIKTGKLQEIFAVKGPGFMISKKLYEQLGGMDENFFLYFEEVDISWRIWLCGYRIVLVPTVAVNHIGAGGTRKLPYEKLIEYSQINKFSTIIKNSGKILLYKLLFWQSSLAIFQGLFCLFTLKVNLSNAYFQSLLMVIKQNKTLLKKRQLIQHSRVISDREILKRVSC